MISRARAGTYFQGVRGGVTPSRHERAVNQICLLERSVQRSGRDQITHPIHGHDDIANSIAGAAWLVKRAARRAELQRVPFTAPYAWSKTSGVISDPAPLAGREKTTTELFYENYGATYSQWPGSGPKEW